VLDNRCSVSHVSAGGDVIDPKADEIAAAQLAVDSEVEHRQIAFAVLDLKSDANGPDLFGPKRTLLANETAFVPCDARRSDVCLDFRGHGRPPRPTAPTAAPAQAGYRIAPHGTAGSLNSRCQTENRRWRNGEAAPSAAVPERSSERVSTTGRATFVQSNGTSRIDVGVIRR